MKTVPFFSRLSAILFAILVYTLLIMRFGYTFGVNDQVELLPYVLYLDNPELYPHDFFIQGMESIIPHERTAPVYFLTLFSGFLQPAVFILHFLCTFFLILGLVRLARMFISNKYWAWLAVAVSLTVLYGKTLGEVELYYNNLIGSSFAKSIAVWGLVFFLERKYPLSALWIGVATLFQPVVGAVLGITLGLLVVIEFFGRKMDMREALKFIALFAVTGGAYLLLLYAVRHTGYDGISNQALFDIMFLFRHPHHYIFYEFPAVNRWFFILLMAFSVYYFRKVDRTVYIFVLVSLTVMVFYILTVDYLNVVFIANFQWYKITIWLKFFGVVGVFAFLEERFGWVAKLKLPLKMELPLLLACITAGVIILTGYRSLLPFNVSYHFGKQAEEEAYLRLLSEIPGATPVDAVFLQPFDDTALKFYGRRSSFVEFKANVKDKKHISEWYRRLVLVYGVDKDMPVKGFEVEEIAHAHYYSLDEASLEKLKAEGATHMLTRSSHELPGLEAVLQNKQHKVVKL